MPRWLLPLSRRGSLLNAASLLPEAAAHMTQRGFQESRASAGSVCPSVVCSSVASGRLSQEERGKKREEKNPPPPTEQPLKHNKAGAAAKSQEPLLSNAHRALGRPVPQSGCRAGGLAQHRMPSDQSQGRLSSMGAAMGQAVTGAPQPGRHHSPMHGHFAKHSCKPRADVPSEPNLSSRVPKDPSLTA